MRLLFLCLFICFTIPVVPTYAGVSVNNSQVTTKLSKKKEKRLKRVTKRAETKNNNKLGLLSTIFGAVTLGFLLTAIFTFIGWFLIAAIGFGIPGIVLGIMHFSKGNNRKGLGIMGLIFSGVGIFISSLLLMLAIALHYEGWAIF